MTKFQFICKCYAITCNTCKVQVYSFFVLWFVPFKTLLILNRITSNRISKVVVDKQTSGCRNITSSIYLKLEYRRYLLSDWDQICFGKSRMTVSFISKELLFKVTSGLAEMTSLSFQLRISLLFYIRLIHNLVTEVRVVHGVIWNIIRRWRSLWSFG